MHDYWPFAITIAVILFGILFNRQDLKALEERFNGRFGEVQSRFDRIESRLDRIEADLREFYRTLGDHGARIDHMEKKGNM